MKITWKKVTLALCAGLGLLISYQPAAAQAAPKQRLAVITDIGNEPDDSESMVRLLLYSNQLDIEALIASTSIHQQTQAQTELIKKVVLGYAQVQPNLLKHEPGFPAAAQLLALIKKGLPVYGMAGVGRGKDSEGSEWLIRLLEKPDPRPLWVTVWGGANTLAQALWKINTTKSAAEAQRLRQKLRVYTISDQDDTGFWIRKNCPDVFFIVSPGTYQSSTWSGIHHIYPGANNEVISNDWLARNIQQDHGPLGALYPDVAFGMEGDTPSWLSLIPTGLSDPEHPNWGGWGGRYELYKPAFDPAVKWIFPLEAETRPIWTNAEDKVTPWLPGKWMAARVKDSVSYHSNFATIWRWREDFQNDFAARMSWCTASYEAANHPPVARLASAAAITVKSGETFTLDGSASSDPDGDNLSYLWFQYQEAGTLTQAVTITPSQILMTIPDLKAPVVSQPQTAHFILKVTDKGTPRLSRYQRVIVTILPK